MSSAELKWGGRPCGADHPTSESGLGPAGVHGSFRATSSVSSSASSRLSCGGSRAAARAASTLRRCSARLKIELGRPCEADVLLSGAGQQMQSIRAKRSQATRESATPAGRPRAPGPFPLDVREPGTVLTQVGHLQPAQAKRAQRQSLRGRRCSSPGPSGRRATRRADVRSSGSVFSAPWIRTAPDDSQ